MQITFICKIFRSSESQTRCDDTLDGWIICQVQEKGCTLHCSTFLKIRTEVTGCFHVNSHSSENDCKVLFVSINSIFLLHEGGLTGNLCCNFIVRQSGGRKDWNFLSTSDGVHDIDRTNSCLNHCLWVIPTGRVDGLSVNIEVGLSKNLGGAIDDLTTTIERATKHLLRNSHLQDISREFTTSLTVVNATGSLKHLNNSTVSGNFQNLSGTN
mmetsp:Transcript_3540/g.4824  ORF Transcript_3540/g.4824 Transcript_3540/m.4824 type:complete len:212 (+) Transcript_3540:1589-2224(+)